MPLRPSTKALLPPLETLGGDPARHGHDADPPTLPAARRPWPVAAECSGAYRAIRESGRRPLTAITLGVVHCTEGDTAIGAARWFTNPDCRGSAHVVVDSFECYRTLVPSLIPWGAPGVNGRGWHLELAGHADWDAAEWLEHRGTLERGAYKMALHARYFHFPVRRLSNRELRAGSKGIIDHRQASSVYGGTHYDVGGGFPWPYWIGRVEHYRARIAV